MLELLGQISHVLECADELGDVTQEFLAVGTEQPRCPVQTLEPFVVVLAGQGIELRYSALTLNGPREFA
ncbi:hypothetical protein CH272_08245 [Rhodococcus sp. 05-340-1]|nr:hypothetical protein CH271_17410 [Rhodococcus sp. 05-340-2]OZD80762.1 hypothetical protein CH272_08245 [Rhodococcus sp. 05-340-1]